LQPGPNEPGKHPAHAAPQFVKNGKDGGKNGKNGKNGGKNGKNGGKNGKNGGKNGKNGGKNGAETIVAIVTPVAFLFFLLLLSFSDAIRTNRFLR